MKKCMYLDGILTAAALACLLISGCTRKQSSHDGTEAQVIYIAHTQTYVPYTFVDENGKSDGFEVAIWEKIAKMYPKYDIRFVPTSDDDLLIGVQTGKYAAGIKGAWATDERRQKYLFPRNYLGASIIGLTFRTEDAAKIHDLESFASFSGKLVPISPESAQFAIITDFNKAHPETQIKLVPSDVFDIPESYTWVLEKRYDGFFDLKVSYKRNVLARDGAYHQYADKLSYVVYQAIPTWPLFNKSQVQLAADYDNAMDTLHKDGTYAELADFYFGEDVSKYVQKQ